MKLNLAKIIDCPGASLNFSAEFDLSDVEIGAQRPHVSPLSVSGTVRNMAGAVILSAVMFSELSLICDRCGRGFNKSKELEANAMLSDDASENDDIYAITGDYADLEDILIPIWILDLDMKFLCSEDCRGLCQSCGADLNGGKCACPDTVPDPRLSVLRDMAERLRDPHGGD